jgi:hypothetical protein
VFRTYNDNSTKQHPLPQNPPPLNHCNQTNAEFHPCKERQWGQKTLLHLLSYLHDCYIFFIASFPNHLVAIKEKLNKMKVKETYTYILEPPFIT